MEDEEIQIVDATSEPIVEEPKQFIGAYQIKEINPSDSGEHFIVKFIDETKADEVYHNDYKELIVTDAPIGNGELMQRKANVVTRPLLDILRKYEFAIGDVKFVIDVLNNIFRENEMRSYVKLFGNSPDKITMNDFDRILK